MKKLTNLWFVIMLMLFLGITSVAEARKGNTSDSNSSSSSSSKSSTTNNSSSSKPAKNTSATNSLFSNIAKTNDAKNAWQQRNKKVDTPVAPVTVPTPTPDNGSTRRQEQQLADIQKQIADAKRQQQIIAAAQTAAQIAAQAALNKRPPVTPTPRVDTNTPIATTSTSTVPVTNPAQPTNNAVNTPINPEKSASGGTSWFMILLVVGGIVFVIFWLKKRNASDTIYRL